jgi:hypothetical protein
MGELKVHMAGIQEVMIKSNLELLPSKFKKRKFRTQHKWLPPVILVTWEAEIARIEDA